MKVVMACWGTSSYVGGSKYLYYLAKHLVRNGINVEFVVDSDKGKEKLKEVDNSIKCTIVGPSKGKRLTGLWSLLYSINLARYLKSISFDILHTCDMFAFAYLHLRTRVPVLYQPWGMEAFTSPAPIRRRRLMKIYRQIVIRPLWRYCGSHAEIVAAEGDFQIEEVMKIYRINREKIFVLPVGVDCSWVEEKSKTRMISREQMGLTNDDFVLLSVNRLTMPKGINYLVDAFYILKQRLPKAKLIIIGDGPEEERITSQIISYKLTASIVHLKDIPEGLLYNYYDLSDVFVCPTLQHDWIMGILEADVCGLPIVSTGQEWLVKDGVNGYVVPPKDPQAMAEAIIKVYNGNRRAMGIASREIAGGYDFEAIARKAIKLYQALVGQITP